MLYTNVCVAGTFDGIHAGHEALLCRAFELGEKVLIGLTSDLFVTSFKLPRSLRERKQDLIGWLVAHRYAPARYKIVPIDDPFEPAASDTTLDALVVSEETKDRGEELNDRRVKRGLAPLVLAVVPIVPGVGKLVMPKSLRPILAKPLGRIVSLKRRSLSKLIITVGDVTTKTFLDAGETPNLMIIDNKVNRKPYTGLNLKRFPKVSLSSGPGYIAREASVIIRQAFLSVKPTVLEVVGEEDLLVLPVVAEAPLGARVYYGQPGIGLVKVLVTEKKKREVIELLKRFV